MRLAALLFFALCSITVHALDNKIIALKVMDKRNRQPIVNAEIKIEDLVANQISAAYSNDSGLVLFPVTKTSRYRITVSKDSKGSSVGYLVYSFIITERDFNTAQAIEVELEKVKRSDYSFLPNLYFNAKSAMVSMEDTATLNNVIVMLKQYPTLQLEISVHSDCTESAGLSLQRMDAINEFLMDRGGDLKRVIVKSYGNERPANGCNCKVSPGCTTEQQSENRRAEFKLLSF
ncbi:MAG: OmpA family protein [Chitinophagales bacterium]